MDMATSKLYRSRKGEVFGLCQGIADWRDVPVGMLRTIVAISILVTGIFPGILIYAIVALFVPLEPAGNNERKNSKEDLRDLFETLKRKVQGMEEEIFDKERDWDSRFHDD